MIPFQDNITMWMIKQELGLAQGTDLKLSLRRVNNILQYQSGSSWFNLNMCSPNLPILTSAGRSDLQSWKGYNHTAYCCTPPFNVQIRQGLITNSPIVSTIAMDHSPPQFPFFVTHSGSTLGLQIIWETSWFIGLDSGQGTNSIQTYISDDSNFNNAFIKVTVINACGQSSKVIEVTRTGGGSGGACTAPSNVLITRNSSTANIVISAGTPTTLTFNGTFNGTGSGTTNESATYDWQFWGEDNFTGQNTPNSSATFNLASGESGWVRLVVSNACGSVMSNTINITTSVGGDGGCDFPNTAQTATVTKECPSGQTGSSHSVTIPAGTYIACDTGTANTQAFNDALSQATNQMNSVGTCISTGTCPMTINSITISVSPTPSNGEVVYNASNKPVITVIINSTGSGFVNLVESLSDSTSTVLLNNGNNTFQFTHRDVPTSTFGYSNSIVELYIQNSDFCSIKQVSQTSSFVIYYPPQVCTDTTWTNEGNPYCEGSVEKQIQRSNCGNLRTINTGNSCGGSNEIITVRVVPSSRIYFTPGVIPFDLCMTGSGTVTVSGNITYLGRNFPFNLGTITNPTGCFSGSIVFTGTGGRGLMGVTLSTGLSSSTSANIEVEVVIINF